MIEREADSDILTRKEAADLCSVSVSTIDYWRKVKGLKRTGRGYLRIDIEEMNERGKMRIVGKHF
jgi:hypothetical protein